MFYLFAIAFGFSRGGLTASTTALVGDIFGTRSIGAIIGVMSAFWSAGAAIGPAIGGFIFDATGNYFTAFAIGAAAMLLVTLFVALIRKTRI